MKRACYRVLIILLALPVLAIACRNTGAVSDKIKVAVSLLPQADFVQAVGGDKVDVTVMVPPGADPHTYEPKPDQMTELAQVQMYAEVGSGIEFELSWLDKLAAVNRNMLIVDCSRGIQLIAAPGSSGQGLKDEHIWMAPENAKIMVRNITAGLAQVDPANQAFYEGNRDSYLQKLDVLDSEIKDQLAVVKDPRFIIYHPVLGYFAREYHLTQIAIEEEGKEPTPARIAAVIDQARQYNIKVVFNTAQYNPRNAELIAREIGGRVEVIDDLARDYINSLRDITGKIRDATQ